MELQTYLSYHYLYNMGTVITNQLEYLVHMYIHILVYLLTFFSWY